LLLVGVRLGRAGSRRDCCGGGADREVWRDVGEFGPPEEVGVAEVAVVGDLLEVAICAVDEGDEIAVVTVELRE
jgi:hypothetical protein